MTLSEWSHGFVLIIEIFWCHFCPGIAMLTFALLMSARMGIFQEMLYKQYGKHSKEALFYNVRVFNYWYFSCNNLQAATAVLTVWDSNISGLCRFTALSASAGLPAPVHRHLQSLRLLQPEQWVPQVKWMLRLKRFFLFTYMEMLSLSAPVSVPMLSISVPIMWLYMLGNIITQYPSSKSSIHVQTLVFYTKIVCCNFLYFKQI